MKLFVILSFLILNSLYSGVLTDSDKPQFPTTNLIKNSGFENSDVSWTSSTIESDGTEDTTFYTNLGTGFNSTIRTSTIQSDGKILVGGDFITFNGNIRKNLVRLNSNGTEDTAFYTNLGIGFDNIIYLTEIQSDGKILIGGEFTGLNGNTRNYLVRLNSDGTEDTVFYTNLGTSFDATMRAIAIQSDGKILVGGQFTDLNGNTRNYLVRLNSDGTEDIAFYANLGTGFNDTVYNISVQSDGKILVGGYFLTLNGNTRNKLVRLNSNGTEDTAFYTNLGAGFNGTTLSLSVQNNNRILVGGSFSTFKGNSRKYIVRLNSDGTEDTNFYNTLVTGAGLGSYVYIINVQSNQKILIGGSFISLNALTRNRLIRLNYNKIFNISSNMAEGLYSASFDAYENNQYFQQSNIYVPYGLRNNQCVFGFYYKGGDANLTAEILDSSDTIISSKVLSTQANWTLINQAFTCPNEVIGLKFKTIATANAAIAYFDNTYIFDNTKGNQKTDAIYGTDSITTFSTNSSTYVDTGISITINTNGRPVAIFVGGAESQEGGDLPGFSISPGGTTAYLRVMKGSNTTIKELTTLSVTNLFPYAFITNVDASPGTGTVTYKIQAKNSPGGVGNITYVKYLRMFVMEL